MFKGVNDSQSDAKKLYELLGKDAYIKINKFNKVKKIASFIKKLESYGMKVEYYETNRDDINAACGQMISE